MRKLLALSVLVGALMVLVGDASARPQYKKAYEAHLGKKTSCTACHPDKKSKKIRNEYADAMAKALGAKNVKDMDAIIKALDAAEAASKKDGDDDDS